MPLCALVYCIWSFLKRCAEFKLFNYFKWFHFYIKTFMKSWKCVLTELLGCVVILSTSLMAVASRDTISAGMAGLSISYSLQVSTNIWLLCSKFETKTTSKDKFSLFLPSRHINFFQHWNDVKHVWFCYWSNIDTWRLPTLLHILIS